MWLHWLATFVKYYEFWSNIIFVRKTNHTVSFNGRHRHRHLHSSFVRSFTAFFISVMCLPWQRPYGKHLQRMSDKCSGGGMIWPCHSLACTGKSRTVEINDTEHLTSLTPLFSHFKVGDHFASAKCPRLFGLSTSSFEVMCLTLCTTYVYLPTT